jgi:N-acetylmuramoyl-L-alanine amidase
MRRAFVVTLLLIVPLTALTTGAIEDLLIETKTGRYRLPATEHNGRPFYQLSRLTAATGCQLEVDSQTVIVDGPSGTLYLTNGRALVRFNSEYILLSSAPWKASKGVWYVAEDFVARALSLVLEEPLRPVGSRHYRAGSVASDIDLELINRPDQVRLIFTPRREMAMSILEYSNRIEVALGAPEVSVLFPPIQPNSQIVSSIVEQEGLLIIGKGTRYDRFEESRPSSGPGLIIDVFGVPSSIIHLPPRPKTPSSPTKTRQDDLKAERESKRFDQLQDWRRGPIHRRQCSVVLDPGHGGEDLGVAWEGLAEKQITLEVAFRIQSILENSDRSCQLTRTRDVRLPIEKRSGIGNYYQPEAFVSIHVGGAASAGNRSAIIYVYEQSRKESDSVNRGELIPWYRAQDSYTGQSKQLGQLIRRHLESVSESPAAVVEAPLAVLQSVRAPAVLIEIGFLTGLSQRGKLQSEEHRNSIANAIAESILEFIQSSEVSNVHP